MVEMLTVDASVDQWTKQFLLVWAMSMHQMVNCEKFVYTAVIQCLEDVWENHDLVQLEFPKDMKLIQVQEDIVRCVYRDITEPLEVDVYL
jgi:hypothetical protein